MKIDNDSLLITKASGEIEAFDIRKLENSLLKAGTSEEDIATISLQIKSWIVPGVSTKEIYSYAFSLLKNGESINHIKYSLKKAFLELGPSGYPFEKIIGELFRRQGFTCKTGVTLQGCCISHEMDVVASKNNTQFLMECKYRQEQGKQISIQTPLYVNSRIKDIVAQMRTKKEFHNFNFQGWVITNTRFSKDSETYGKCKGLKLLSWDYPTGEGLKDLVEKHNLYPVSILSSISPNTIQQCLNEGIVTCSQLINNKDFINSLEISTAEKKLLITEMEGLLKH